MALFSKKPKVKPTIETQGLRIEFDSENGIWQFNDEGFDFVIYGSRCAMPSPEQLREIEADINRLRPEMIRRLEEGLRDCEGAKMNDGETFLVNVTDLQSQGAFEVCWSGGQSWGDMGIDFMIKNRGISDESWGD
jgi:hypothetical protein